MKNVDGVRGEFPDGYIIDAELLSIVAEAPERVKLATGYVFVVAGLAKGGKLHYENCDGTHQKNMHHAALVKKERQHAPNQEEYSRDKPEFHVFTFQTMEITYSGRIAVKAGHMNCLNQGLPPGN